VTNESIERLLGRMCERVPELLTEKGYNRDTCILHTRLAVDALRAAGLRAAPLAVQLAVFNAAFARWTYELGRMPEANDTPPPEIWTVHVGYGTPPKAERPGYDGHVIATVNGRYALDLTADQTARPQKGIDSHPHWWIMDEGFMAGGQVHVFRTAGGAYLRYEAMPEDRGFLRASDWQLPARTRSSLVPSTEELLALVA
jgi:hypothetical protein